MPELISFDSTYVRSFIKDHEFSQLDPFVQVAHDMICRKNGAGKEWLGWVDLPLHYSKNEMQRIGEVADKIRSKSDVLVIIGIGGSYLGARAVIEMLCHPFANCLQKIKRAYPEIYFVGHHLSSDYIHGLLDLLSDKEVSINVISKSGTTLEPAIAFRIFREYMVKRYGEEAKSRIFVTTDEREGVLRKLSNQEGYTSFTIPADIGGRYSVLTPVGLVPISVAGINIEELMLGAQQAAEAFKTPNSIDNICYQYAAIRTLLCRKGRGIELLASYLPSLTSFSEWWKQLFGESEGKDGKGIFPVSVQFTTDLHSLGQYIQDGPRNFFQTVLSVQHSCHPILLQKGMDDIDGLNYIAGSDLDIINRIAYQGTLMAHVDGGVPVSVITLDKLTPRFCGQLIYFFQKACAISGYLLGVNPFNQSGVEEYKKNMFHLLGKSKDALHMY